MRAVILDVDGTLVDSNDAHADAWVDAFAERGLSIPFEKLRPLIGMGGDKVLREAVGLEKEREPGRTIAERRSEIFQSRYLPHLKPFPAARELLARMRENGLKLVTATSSNREELEGLLRIIGAGGLIDATTSATDVQNTKPDPDLVFAALEKIGSAPHEVVMLGDTPYDLAAARQAGVATIALRCGGWSDAELAGAIAIYDDPADLLARYDQSPLSKRS
jgi:HAD superfamily hydrolase (TIGR01509 family)